MTGAEGDLIETVGANYDKYELSLTDCPPPIHVAPFPSASITITDLNLVFDENDRVSDFVLQGVVPEPAASSNTNRITKDRRSGSCKVTNVSLSGTFPDKWGLGFASLHNPAQSLDNWQIEGDESYVATDTIQGRTEGSVTEDTTLVLTVTQN